MVNYSFSFDHWHIQFVLFLILHYIIYIILCKKHDVPDFVRIVHVLLYHMIIQIRVRSITSHKTNFAHVWWNIQQRVIIITHFTLVLIIMTRDKYHIKSSRAFTKAHF